MKFPRTGVVFVEDPNVFSSLDLGGSSHAFVTMASTDTSVEAREALSIAPETI